MGDFKKWEDPSNGELFWNEGLIPLHDYGNNKLIDKKKKEKVDAIVFGRKRGWVKRSKTFK